MNEALNISIKHALLINSDALNASQYSTLFERTEQQKFAAISCVCYTSPEQTTVEYKELQNKLPNTSHLGNFYKDYKQE